VAELDTAVIHIPEAMLLKISNMFHTNCKEQRRGSATQNYDNKRADNDVW
jgi:hypothetical protein